MIDSDSERFSRIRDYEFDPKKSNTVDKESFSELTEEEENWIQRKIPKDPFRVLSVTEASRLHSGTRSIRGVISSISELFKMISAVELKCLRCNLVTVKVHDNPIDVNQFNNSNSKWLCSREKCDGHFERIPTYINAVTIELRDAESFNDLDKLKVIVFEKNTYDITVGENVIISGEIGVILNAKKGKAFSVLYAESIKYENKEDESLTESDIQEIRQFNVTSGSDVIKGLISLTATSVIGHEDIKEGILLSAANSKEDEPTRRKRIHVLLAGPPGLAKTLILVEAAKLVVRSSVEVAQSSSGLSLTAMVVREDEMYMLRLGPIPRARGAICGIDEINRMSYHDQSQMLNYMQTGTSTLNKYGIHAFIRGPTTIIASANPTNPSSWILSNGKVDLSQLTILPPLLDRFDLRFILKKPTNIDEVRDYANRKAELEDKEIPDHSPFLRKYIEYSKKFEPKLTEEAKFMLTEYYTNATASAAEDRNAKANSEFESPRSLESLFSLTRARTRLKLKDIAEEQDAEETIEFFNRVSQDYRESVGIPTNPRDVAVSLMLEILKDSVFLFPDGIGVEQLCKATCERDKQVSAYLGDKLSIDSNHKVRAVVEILRSNKHVKQIKNKPIVLQWNNEPDVSLSDASDASDVSKMQSVNKNENANMPSEQILADENIANHNFSMSDKSDRSDSSEKKENKDTKTELELLKTRIRNIAKLDLDLSKPSKASKYGNMVEPSRGVAVSDQSTSKNQQEVIE